MRIVLERLPSKLLFFLQQGEKKLKQVVYRKTAKTFLAASVFLEILKTFGEIDPEVKKTIFCNDKATFIHPSNLLGGG
jgi:vacuolar protein sorting-associated protein VTA1